MVPGSVLRMRKIVFPTTFKQKLIYEIIAINKTNKMPLIGVKSYTRMTKIMKLNIVVVCVFAKEILNLIEISVCWWTLRPADSKL